MKKVLIMCYSSPFGTNSAIEAIRLGAGYLGLGEDIECAVVLSGDAVLTMNTKIDPTPIGIDSPAEGIEMADLSDLPLILIKEDMEIRGMSNDDIYEFDEPIQVISKQEIPILVEKYDTVFRV